MFCETQIDALPNPAGVISQVLTTNTSISPTNTFYTAELWNQGRVLSSGNYIFNGNTDLSVAGTINPAPAPQGPSSIIFENNGTLNSSQTTLNLESTDSSVLITDVGAGTLNLKAASNTFNTPGVGGFWSVGFPMFMGYIQSGNAAAPSTTIDKVTVYQFTLNNPWTISSVGCYVNGGAANGSVNFGIYSVAGNKLLDSGALIATGTGVVQNVIGSVTLPAGTYYFAQSSHVTAVTVYTFTAAGQTNMNSVLNNSGTVKVGSAANLTVSGSMPSTLGVITAGSTLAMAAAFFGV